MSPRFRRYTWPDRGASKDDYALSEDAVQAAVDEAGYTLAPSQE